MSAEYLRETAALMREDRDTRWLAVADLLVHIANDIENAFSPEIYVANSPSVQKAFAVARAYRGDA